MENDQIEPIVKRWVGYVCPECHMIFRMETGNGGRRAQCPGCRSLVILGGKLQAAVGASQPSQPTDAGSGNAVAILTDEEPVEIGTEPRKQEDPGQEDPGQEDAGQEDTGAENDEVSKEGRQRIKKRKGVPKEPDWEKSKRKKKIKRMGWVMPLMVIIALVAIGGGVAYWARSIVGWGVGEEEVIPDRGGLGDPSTPDDMKSIIEGIDTNVVVSDVKGAVAAFLGATTVEELLETVRDRERLEPVIRQRYADGYGPVGVREIAPQGELQTLGKLFSVVVELEDFSQRPIALEKSADGFLVDWESWVGHSELPWDEFMRLRPTEPTLFRVTLEKIDYYNFDFSDDRKWQSFRLESPDREQTLYAYAPQFSELARELSPLDAEKNRTTYTLELRYPDGATKADQVLVERVVASGWVVTNDGGRGE